MTKDEALRLVLEALEYFSDTSPNMAGKAHAEDAITAIKAALEAKDEKQKPVNIKKVAEEHGINLPTEFVPKHDESKAAIQSLTDQCAALIWERDELQRQMWRYEKQEPVAWKWHQAPVKTSWGDGMVVADLAVDKDNTVSIYCERDQTAKVEAMFTQPQQEAKDEPVAYPDGDVVGPCICGSWPGGKCLKCPRITPPQRKPLTLEQLREHWKVAKVLDMTDAEIDFADYVLIARDVEALHGIKGEA